MAGFPVSTLFQAGGINSISFAGVEFAASWSRVFRTPRLRYSVKDSFYPYYPSPIFLLKPYSVSVTVFASYLRR